MNSCKKALAASSIEGLDKVRAINVVKLIRDSYLIEKNTVNRKRLSDINDFLRNIPRITTEKAADEKEIKQLTELLIERKQIMDQFYTKDNLPF